jgi:hypothetical protein
MQRVHLGPRYAVRLSQLGRFHILCAECPCRHAGPIARRHLQPLPPWTYLIDLEKRFRCRQCGQRGEARFYVVLMARD